MTPAVTIRPALAEDLEGIHRVERASFPDPWSMQTFVDVLVRESEGSAQLLVACEGGAVVGFVVAERADPEVHIANVAIDPARRRSGIGRSLMDAVLAWACDEGLEEAWLEVRQSNTAARNLYRALGFSAVSTRRGYYRWPTEDAVVMVLHLRSVQRLHEERCAVSLAPRIRAVAEERPRGACGVSGPRA